jgi:hypothetical protein
MPAPPFPPPPATYGPAATPAAQTGTSGPTTPIAAPPTAGSQRRQGTLYGGPGSPGSGQLTMALPPGDPVENSGSLTGHILAQGWPDTPTSPASTTKVVVALLVGLGILVVVGLLVVFAVGDIFSNLFGGVLNS